jgi:phage shock protein PspC (stress-responsive transcriptional regulator)
LKQLKKSDGPIWGVCGGISEYFDIDPTIVRIVFLAGLFFWGNTLLIYIILALSMPSKDS